MTTAVNQAFVVEAKDYPACKNLEIVKTYPHPNKVYGCQWNPTKQNEFITACEDGMIRVFDFSINSTNPVKTLEGHTRKVYNVVFSPILPNVCASGSDDRTIRIWRTD